jgi:multimeric flavodoxin WrbA
MNTLFVLGSPRKGGNTEILVNHVRDGVEEAGGTAELVRLAGLKIEPCTACGGCEKTGRCVILDDMHLLYDKIDRADRLVIASPIYFYGVTAQTKAFIDRSQAMWSRKYLLGKQLSRQIPRIGYFISVGATRGERMFEGAILTVKYGLDAMDFAYGGELLVRQADHKGAVNEMPAELDRARRFGRKIVEDRGISAAS